MFWDIETERGRVMKLVKPFYKEATLCEKILFLSSRRIKAYYSHSKDEYNINTGSSHTIFFHNVALKMLASACLLSRKMDIRLCVASLL